MVQISRFCNISYIERVRTLLDVGGGSLKGSLFVKGKLGSTWLDQGLLFLSGPS